MGHSSVEGKPHRPLATLLAAVALIALVAACGGSKDADSPDNSPVSEKQAGEVARQYVLTVFGVLSGKNTPQQLIDLYAPECRANVNAQDIAATMLLVRAFLPEIDKLRIDDVDLGALNYEPNDKGVLVSPQDPNNIRVKVHGDFVKVDDYFKSVGFADDDTTNPTNEPLLVVKHDGKAYIGDCSGLSDLALTSGSSGSSGSSGPGGFSGTVTIGSPQATGPGRSRTDAIRLGGSATVEDTWKVQVVQVRDDAWDAVMSENSFGDPPAANERIVLIRVSVENVSKDDQPQTINDFEFALTGSHNELYDAYDHDHHCFGPDDLDAQLFPKGSTQGDLCFRIPRDETDLLLVWDSFAGGQTYFKLN